MLTIFWILLLVGGAFYLAYRGTKLFTWTVAAAGALALVQWFGAGFSLLPWIALGAIAAVLNLKPIRRRLISSHLFRWFRSVLPPMSETEQAAIDAGLKKVGKGGMKKFMRGMPGGGMPPGMR